MLKRFTPTLVVLAVLAGCAKERNYDSVYKKPEILKRDQAFKLTEAKEVEVTNASGAVTGTVTKQVPVKYLYVPMTLGTPREVVEAAPFYQGDEKIVKLEWSKKGLEVLEMERDSRFSDNELNDTPVLTIPGKFASYRCREDNYGNCTNAEEENTELEDLDKDYFTPDYAKLEVREVNMLDAAGIEGSGCVSKVATEITDYEVKPGVINIELEKTYKVNNKWACIANNYFTDKFAYNSFKVKFFYSLVELSELASKNYNAVSYPIPDQDEFGYFKNERLVLNGTFDSARKVRESLLNRWNPNRENNELVYYLSKSHNKPKNKIFLDATYKAQDIINKGLKEANAPFKVKFVKQDDNAKEVSTGDLRYNTVVLIDDPLANGLLGYGPSVSNPETGEIVQAHVNMYGGVLQTTTRRVYNAAVDITVDKLNAKKAQAEVQASPSFEINSEIFNALPPVLAQDIASAPVAPAASTAQASQVNASELNALVNSQVQMSNVGTPKLTATQMNKMLAKVSLKSVNTKMALRSKRQVNAKEQYAQNVEGKFEGFDDLQKRAFQTEHREQGKSILGKHEPEFFAIGNTVKVVNPELFDIPGILVTDGPLKGTLKKWENLSEFQKQSAHAIILTDSYVATFVHEFGHNFGLRHNFSGSFDKENFYTPEELKAMGLEHRTPSEAEVKLGLVGTPAYSSVMDYSFSEFNQLKSLGKYDVAALRFAYAREVVAETYSGDFDLGTKKITGKKVYKVTGNLSDLKAKLAATKAAQEAEYEAQDTPAEKRTFTELAPYMFCTDENAGLSSNCNRFDEGSSLKEIAEFRVKRYKDAYKYRNFRDGRLDFNSYDVSSYLIYRYREFAQIRDIIEEYEFFTTIFDPQLMQQGCSPEQLKLYPVCLMINDRKEAVETVGNLFVDILKTPDHQCALVKPEAPNMIVELRTLFSIYEDIRYSTNHVPTSCFDEGVKAKLATEGLQVVGENGKYLNGFKDNNPNYKYKSDRAVLGYWPDKVMAMRSLFSRTWRNRTTDDEFMSLMDIPAISEKVSNVITHLAMGTPLSNPQPFKMEDGRQFQVAYTLNSEHKIEQLENAFGWIKRFLDMPRQGLTNLNEALLAQTVSSGADYGEAYTDQAYNQVNFASIGFYDSDLPGREVVSYSTNGRIYLGYEDTPIATYMLTTINSKQLLDAAPSELVAKVVKQRTNPDAPAELSANHKAFFALDSNWHEALIGYANQNAPLTVEQFAQTFGAEQGPLIFAVFQEGAQMMTNLVNLKAQLMNTPSADATEAELALYNIPVNVLADYAAGRITDGLVEFYTGQLKRLPGFIRYPNI